MLNLGKPTLRSPFKTTTQHALHITITTTTPNPVHRRHCRPRHLEHKPGISTSKLQRDQLRPPHPTKQQQQPPPPNLRRHRKPRYPPRKHLPRESKHPKRTRRCRMDLHRANHPLENTPKQQPYIKNYYLRRIRNNTYPHHTRTNYPTFKPKNQNKNNLLQQQPLLPSQPPPLHDPYAR